MLQIDDPFVLRSYWFDTTLNFSGVTSEFPIAAVFVIIRAQKLLYMHVILELFLYENP
jgi:hypothetical protein